MQYERIRTYCANHRKDLLPHLKTLVNISSGTTNPEGVNEVIGYCQRFLDALGFSSRREGRPGLAANLVSTSPGNHGARILAMGHADTVFPLEQPRREFQRKQDKCFGPGVCDMKGGLVALLCGLKALKEVSGGFPNSITVMINGDEEITSPSSKGIIKTLALKADFGLVLEPGVSRMRVVTRRSGLTKCILRVKGRAAHSGSKPWNGASAVRDLAEKIPRLEDLSDRERGINVNVGLIRGGMARNVVPPFAEAEIDVRFRTGQQGEEVMAHIRKIAEMVDVPGTKPRLKTIHGRPPLIFTPAAMELMKLYRSIATWNGWHLSHGRAGGCSDGNFASFFGLPTLDGLGPTGGHAHSEREFIYTESLFERTLFASQILGADYMHLLPVLREMRNASRVAGRSMP
jgi:glutamate carboxypeptidase